MPARIPVNPSLWLQRARSWCLALLGPLLWFCLLGLTHSLAGHACGMLARLQIGALVALGVSLCGTTAVLGLRRLQQHGERDPDARYLLLASGALHAFFMFVLFAQLVPIMLGVSCQQP